MNAFGAVVISSTSKPCALEQGPHAAAGEVLDVGRQHRPPALAHRTREPRPGIGQGHRQYPAGLERARDASQCGGGIDDVLDYVAHEDGGELALADVGIVEALGANVETEPLARVGGGPLGRLEPESLPSPFLGLGEQESDPAADIEQPASRTPGFPVDLGFDPLDDPAGGLALPRLLLDVIGRLSLGVEGRKLLRARHSLELHVAAAPAADDVG